MSVKWILLVHDKVWWQAFRKTVMEFLGLDGIPFL
jgi:hypothetical protein